MFPETFSAIFYFFPEMKYSHTIALIKFHRITDTVMTDNIMSDSHPRGI